MKKKCLIIEPHSDDSLIAAGGFMQKYSSEYQYYFCLVTASDLNMRHGFVPRIVRLNEYAEYVKVMDGELVTDPNLEDPFPLDFESRLDLYPRAKLVRKIEDILNHIDPDVLMIMGPSFHHDHTAVYEAAIAATRPTVSRKLSTIYLMENATYAHELYEYKRPNLYVALSEQQINNKIKIFDEVFISQARNSKNILSNDGMHRWAAYRGVEARAEYAEAFVQYQKII